MTRGHRLIDGLICQVLAEAMQQASLHCSSACSESVGKKANKAAVAAVPGLEVEEEKPEEPSTNLRSDAQLQNLQLCSRQ